MQLTLLFSFPSIVPRPLDLKGWKGESTSLEDGGEYVCQVQTGQGLKEAKHSVIVQVPPSILPVPTESLVTAKQGESVSLRCNATGQKLFISMFCSVLYCFVTFCKVL